MPSTAQRGTQRPLHAPTHEPAPQVIVTPDPQPAVTAWVGWIWFGVAIMAMIGIFNVIAGIIAIADDNFLVGAAGKLYVVDATAWGWTTLAIGVLVLAAAYAVTRGSVWGRAVAVVMATANAVVQLSIIRAYPVWGLLVIMLDVFVIYALIVHGSELQEPEYG
ncbi:MAG TPA: hypothetical protein VG076_02165 [Acidimicrobiales bacterium]|jgi:hypothetical protein|nr:hypothetical protein [Acidimicrobiales bacterium]